MGVGGGAVISASGEFPSHCALHPDSHSTRLQLLLISVISSLSRKALTKGEHREKKVIIHHLSSNKQQSRYNKQQRRSQMCFHKLVGTKPDLSKRELTFWLTYWRWEEMHLKRPPWWQELTLKSGRKAVQLANQMLAAYLASGCIACDIACQQSVLIGTADRVQAGGPPALPHTHIRTLAFQRLLSLWRSRSCRGEETTRQLAFSRLFHSNDPIKPRDQ